MQPIELILWVCQCSCTTPREIWTRKTFSRPWWFNWKTKETLSSQCSLQRSCKSLIRLQLSLTTERLLTTVKKQKELKKLSTWLTRCSTSSSWSSFSFVSSLWARICQQTFWSRPKRSALSVQWATGEYASSFSISTRPSFWFYQAVCKACSSECLSAMLSLLCWHRLQEEVFHSSSLQINSSSSLDSRLRLLGWAQWDQHIGWWTKKSPQSSGKSDKKIELNNQIT